MGNTQALTCKIQALNTQNWVEAGQNQQIAIFSNVNPYRRRLLANIVTHQLIEEYQLNFITEQDYNSYITELAYRQIKPSFQKIGGWNFIYPIRYFLNKSKHQMCTTIHSGYLYIDKVELRLKQINDIPFQDLLYIYKATLIGFKLLYEKVGYFDIIEQMIFIDKSGQVKVWMNANLAKNYPNYQKTSFKSTTSDRDSSEREAQTIYGSQADMIRKLILMIQKNSDQFRYADQLHPSQQNYLFSQFLQDKNIFDKLSFQHSLDEFENYLRQNNLHCHDFMRSIPELFCPDQIANNRTTNYEQSHVKQITSQHLTRMKRKFQPMETIPEDDRINTKTTNKLFNSPQHHNFQQSNVGIYTQGMVSNQKEFFNHETENRNVVRPEQGPFIDLNQSGYSNHSNKVVPNEYKHPQKSLNSSVKINPYLEQKTNSVSTLKYNLAPIQSQNMANQYQFNPSNQKFIPLPSHQYMVNANHLNSQQLHGNFMNYNSQKVMIMSPRPSYRTINLSNSLNSQSRSFQTQLIWLPPQTNFVSFKNSKVQNESNMKKHQNIIKTQGNKVILANNIVQQNRPLAFSKETLKQSKLQQGHNFGSSVERSAKKKSPFTELRRQRQQNEQKSKIKYFTKSDSYQLDQQIASDLQKFLGLKVN